MDSVGGLQSGRLITISPSAAVAEAAAALARERVSHLLVTRERELLGVLCACDVDRADQRSPVSLAMSRALWTIEAEMHPEVALAMMREHGVSCLPVFTRGVLTGIITLHDLARCGVAADAVERCTACGSEDHVRCAEHGRVVGLCLDCMRRSEPPAWDEELGGSS